MTREHEPTGEVVLLQGVCQGAAKEYSIRFARALTGRWWILPVRGVAAILFGVLAMAMPGSSLLALVILWAAYAIVEGAFAMMLAARRGRTGRRWGWLLFEGIVGIVAGVTALVWPGITALALQAVVAVWAVSTGIAKIAAAIWLRRQINGEWLLAGSGLLSIAFGALLALSPGSGALALAWLMGAYVIVLGALLVGLGLRLNRWRRSAAGAISSAGAAIVR